MTSVGITTLQETRQEAPIQVENGITLLANKVQHVRLLPVAFRYEFFNERKPVAMIQIGPPYEGTWPIDDTAVMAMLSTQAIALSAAAQSRCLDGFTPISPRQFSLDELLDLPRQLWQRDKKESAQR